LSLRTTIKEKLEKKPMTLDELFNDFSKKNDIKRETIRGRLWELKHANEVEKVGLTYSLLPS